MVYLMIMVCPRAGKRAYQYDYAHERLKVYLKSAPERGAANSELIAVLAEWLSLPKRSIMIVSGQTVRLKRIAIDAPMSKVDIMNILKIPIQSNLLRS